MSDPFDFTAHQAPVELLGSLTLEDLSVASERVWQRGWDAAARHFADAAVQEARRVEEEAKERIRTARDDERERAAHRAAENVREILNRKPASRVDVAIRKAIEGLPKNASMVLRNELEGLRIQVKQLASVLESVDAWAKRR
jgi:hypothetical protein